MTMSWKLTEIPLFENVSFIFEHPVMYINKTDFHHLLPNLPNSVSVQLFAAIWLTICETMKQNSNLISFYYYSSKLYTKITQTIPCVVKKIL